MAGFWVQVLVAVVAGVLGVAATLVVLARRRRRTPPAPPPPPVAAPAVPGRDRWLPPVRRCEQAVSRATRVVESVSSTQARGALRCVIRRMEAELPDVRMLMELGRGLDAAGRHDDPATGRVHRQLEDAATRFTVVTGQVLDVVAELVAEPDLSRVRSHVADLRQRFPLLRPMSDVLRPARDAPTTRALADIPA